MTNRLIFMHQAKTAGSSIKKMLQDNINVNDIIITDGIKYAMKYDKSIINRVSFYAGHCRYGDHIKLNFSNYKYITVLRDPIQRVISLYNYINYKTDHPKHIDIQNYSLYDYIEKNEQMQNGQFKRMSGNINIMWPDFIEIIQKDFLYVGIFKHIEEVILSISKIFNIQTAQTLHANKTLNKKIESIENVDQRTINKIISYNKLDIQLYNLMLKKYPYYKEKIDLIY